MKVKLPKLSIVSIVILFFSLFIVIYSCTKSDLSSNQTYVQDQSFFKKDSSFKNVFYAINGSLANDTLLDKMIAHFKDFDSKAKIVNEIERKYGKAYWDISFVIRDFNGLRTVVTPIINTADTVTALIFSSEKNSNYTYFRVIDKKTEQTNLKKYGDKNATQFTQYTLKGLFSATQHNYNYAKNIVKGVLAVKQYMPNSEGTHMELALPVTTCWDVAYEESACDDCDLTSVVVGTQCSTSYIYIDDGGTGLGSTTPTYGGGGTNSQSSLSDVKNLLKSPCPSYVANKIINSNLSNTITDILKNTFNVNDKLNVTFLESTLKGESSWTIPGTINNGVLDETIYINPNYFSSASQEYIASLLIHEIIHAYLDVNTSLTGNLQQHTEMVKSYIDKMATSLQGFYPGLSLQQAESLSLQGLGDIVTNSSDFSALLAQYGFNQDPSSTNNYANYAMQFETGNIGTNCNAAIIQ